MDAEHAGQTVLADAGGVHAQFQIRVDVSIEAHGHALVLLRGIGASRLGERKMPMPRCKQSKSQTWKVLSINILLRRNGWETSEKPSIVPKYLPLRPIYLGRANYGYARMGMTVTRNGFSG